jgi:membrane associated rhomboid family serine protease
VVIHKDLAHMIFNLIPLFAGLAALYFFYPKIASLSLVTLWLSQGIFTWIFGRQAWHIGASGLVYGLLSFLLFSGFIRKNRALSVVAALVVFFYGGLFWGLFPVQAGVSFEAHLSGFISGIALAIILRKKGPRNDPGYFDDDDGDDDPYRAFGA